VKATSAHIKLIKMSCKSRSYFQCSIGCMQWFRVWRHCVHASSHDICCVCHCGIVIKNASSTVYT